MLLLKSGRARINYRIFKQNFCFNEVWFDWRYIRVNYVAFKIENKNARHVLKHCTALGEEYEEMKREFSIVHTHGVFDQND